ncbi:polysaccharide lyase family 8 protein [Mycena crocata]|nr:polysaccharide lyase family 8 protein [Mycena crocata]
MKTCLLVCIYIFYLSSALATTTPTPTQTHTISSTRSTTETLFSVNATSNAVTTTSLNATSISTTSASTTSPSLSTNGTTSSSASASISGQPTSTSTPIDPATAQDVKTIHERRLSNIVGALTNASSISSWLSTLQSNGQWPDLDYRTGCDAQRANWPAQLHWNRISTMAGAWNGGLAGASQYVKDAGIRSSISLAMGYWFANDFSIPACLMSGGTAACPCGTPGLWNTNWFGNTIGTPNLVSMSCLLLNDTLLPAELEHCTTITGRAYGVFVTNVGFLTGANTLDVAKIGIDQALLTVNISMLTDAYRRVHAELTIATAVQADGIRPDGSFGQHGGILYNGNYGKDYLNDVVDLEVESGGTQFEATPASQTALATLIDGDRWMIYANALTGILHWDFSALGRFISFPTADFTQATASILLNLTKIDALGQEWGSRTLLDFSKTLSRKATSANAGNLRGNRMFYDNDYMVHRGSAYVTTLKMYSSRSRNSECVNLANPFGFHLSDGALRNYQQGNEYEDIAAAMDWNLIPGTTVDYGATPLNCNQTQWAGVTNFVGGASDGKLGLAAMRYTNPLTHNLHWQKSWFFLEDDVQLVMVANVSSATNASVISVLDQRRHSGPVILDTGTRSESSFAQHGVHSQSLWHGNVGYSFPDFPGKAFSLSVEVGEKMGNWTALGTSTQPPITVDLFSAWIIHDSLNTSLAYTIYPGTDFRTFIKKSSHSQVRVFQNDASISAVQSGGTVMIVFWDLGGGSIGITPNSAATFTISATGTAAFMFDIETGIVTVSDPTQTLSTVSVTLSVESGKPSRWGGRSKTLNFTLPSGGFAGSSVSQNVYR